MECAVITNNSMPKNVDGLVSDSYNRRRGIPLQSETLCTPNLDLLNFFDDVFEFQTCTAIQHLLKYTFNTLNTPLIHLFLHVSGCKITSITEVYINTYKGAAPGTSHLHLFRC